MPPGARFCDAGGIPLTVALDEHANGEGLVERAGLKGQLKDVCHIYRRTLTRNAVDQGVPRPYIKSKMGWSTEAMIEHYTAGMELESEATEAFNRLKPFGG